ncbi:MazG nucleotide pyrophosphohydrolase domain-containing protein [Virgibacillus subterraneus]|uniref:MazG nucleotide pyrophosphohydrolase domain-containing protein n=1 Tax=Virgibacillus subterraneus TaxID=621109 RepID=A0A1H9GAD2_9BACI|nr:MazG nucleotide pyrophosphohydrolase domain-containing protein [Virgibacillus subterraneus]SEQ47036.1 MazG nucleotide pyrophosphohydrolase domain-containing protein [Virgibacillus subterraneus]
MKDIQIFLKYFQRDMNWEISDSNYQETKMSMLNNFMLLSTEVSEIAEEFRSIFNETSDLANEGNLCEDEAFDIAKEKYKVNIGKELSDCIAYLVKFANYFNIDLDESFYTKMDEIRYRKNRDN